MLLKDLCFLIKPKEGIAVAELIAGKPGHVNYDIIPSVIYTNPEAVSVGMTEEMVQREINRLFYWKISFMANGESKS